VNATYSVCPNHRPGGRHVTVREQRRVFRRSRVRESLTAREQLGPAAGAAGDPALADPRWLADDGQPDGNDAGRTAVGRNYFSANVWKPALKAGARVARENGTHALRHLYASSLLDGGESIRTVSEYLGHADPGFTLRVYTHLRMALDPRVPPPGGTGSE
jgi:integrase